MPEPETPDVLDAASTAPRLVRIAVLNGQNYLVGYDDVAQPGPADVIVGADCDLASDGSYKWMPEKGYFLPLGFGHGQVPTKSPFPMVYVLARMVEAMGDNAPEEGKEWLKWFNAHDRKRIEETVHARKKAKAVR